MKHSLFTRGGKPPSNVDTVVTTIKDLLIKRHLKPGDQIPSENELSEALAISRGSIREAMKILAAFGVIEIRQGDGTYISTSVNKKLFDPLLFSVLVTDPELDELAELRILIECGIVKLIVAHASDDDIARLEAKYRRMAELDQEESADEVALFGADVEFHRVMAEITGNYLVRHVYGFVMDLFAPTMHPGHGLESHRKIVDALYARDVSTAVAAVEEHDETWQRLVQEDRAREDL